MPCTFCSNESKRSGYCNQCFARLHWCDDHVEEEDCWSCPTCHRGSIHDSMGFSITRTITSTIRYPHRDIGVVTWNIHDFKDGSHKRQFIQAAFKRNPWLDIMALQEVGPNDDLAVSGLTVVSAIEMVAITPRDQAPSNPKKAKSFKLGTQVSNLPTQIRNLWVTPSQRELFPLIIRKGADITVHGCAAYYGARKYEGEYFWWCKRLRWRKDWNKFTKTKKRNIRNINEHLPQWRPIIVYELTVRGLLVNVAVVHTTPRGSGLGREEEYLQVSEFLQYAGRSKDRWIILGDYYLDPQASIKVKSGGRGRTPRDYFETSVKKSGLYLLSSISATNQSAVKGVKVATKNRAYSEKGSVVVNKCADMLVCSSVLAKRCVTGLLDPKACFIRIDPEHRALNYWASSSDHLPMAALMCMDHDLKRFCQIESLNEVAPMLELLASEDLWRRKSESLEVLERCLNTLSYGLIYYYGKGWEEHQRAIEAICVLVYFTLVTYGRKPVVLYQLQEWIKTHVKTKESTILKAIEQLARCYDQLKKKHGSKADGREDAASILYRAVFDVRRALNVLEQGTGMYDPVSESLTYGDPPNPVVFEYDGLAVRELSRDTLQPGEYVDDDVMVVYYRFLSNYFTARTAERGGNPFALVPPALAYMIANNADVNAAANELIHAIGGARWVFLPINDNPNPAEVGGTHWTLLVLDRQTRSFHYLDTLNGSSKPGMQVATRIKKMLGLTGVTFQMHRAPQQQNPDCGIYVMSLTESICNAILSNTDLWDFSTVPRPSATRRVLFDWMTDDDD